MSDIKRNQGRTHTRASAAVPKQFRHPRKSIGEVDAAGLATLLAAASDLSIVVDPDAKVHDVATAMPMLQREDVAAWTGRSLLDTLTPESRTKAETLLAEAASGDPPRWRELNIALEGGSAIAVDCVALRLGGKDRIVIVGRDLSRTSTIQQRLLAAQAETEREYARLRQAETRFALLFETSAEAILIVAPANQRITEVNPAAAALFGKIEKRLVGRSLTDLLEPSDGRAVGAMLATVQGAGRADDVRARIDERDVLVAAIPFRHERGEHFLVRLKPVGDEGGVARVVSDVGDLVETLPDAFVVTDESLKIVRANAAFLELAQVANPALLRDQPLGRWLGRPGVDVDALVKVLEQHGVCKSFPTMLRGSRGLDEDVEVSAVLVPGPERRGINVSIRPVPRRRSAAGKIGRQLPQSVEQMTELVGRVPLKEMVREATDWIERLSIEAALLVTGDNRASAADMLGFSRQSLYMKMRRFGIGVPSSDDET